MTTKALQLVNGVPRMTSVLPTIYDQEETGLTITAGVNHTLPASGSYSSTELEVYVNGLKANVVDDFNYVGSGTRTQIAFTFNIVATDVLRYVIERNQ